MKTTRWTVCFLIAAIAGTTWLNFSVAGQNDKNDRQAQAALQAAVNKEHVDGNLDSAIKQYKEVVSKYTNQRAVVADALIHMAEAYQKLGDVESQKVYQRIVREFGDQKDALAVAQARLGGTAVTSAKGDRPVWTGPKIDQFARFARVSPDGRFITYIDRTTASLMIHDLAANTDRALTPPDSEPTGLQATYSRISRDGKQVVYQWGPIQFRIAELQGSGFLQPRTVFTANGDVRISGNSFDWSPDRKWIAATSLGKPLTSQIALIAVADGSFRILKSMVGGMPGRILFSPDSKTIAYDRIATDSSPQRDVFVLTIDGSREILAAANGAVMGWSPDGTKLLFSRDRTGSVDLWAQPFANGNPQGQAELLKSNIGSSAWRIGSSVLLGRSYPDDFGLGMSDSGALYVYKRISSRDIAIAPINLEPGRLLGPLVSFANGFIEGAAYPNWSPDGKSLAYAVPCDNGCFAIRSVATGQVRRIASTLIGANAPSWSPDGRSLLARGNDAKGRQGIFQIDVQTGEAIAVVLADVTNMAHWAPTGKKVYYRLSSRGVIVERDLMSGAERDVYAGAAGILSPDGQYFAVARTDASTKRSSVQLVPVAGGQSRELLRLTQPEVLGRHTWTPDSSAVMFDKNTGSRMELWLAPVNGGEPRKLDIDPDIWLKGSVPQTGQQGVSLSPDGRNIAVYTGTDVSEVWALENFLPSPETKK